MDYYYSLGLYRTAEAKLQQLKRDYPHSHYASTQLGTNISSLKKQTVPYKEMPKGSEQPDSKRNNQEKGKSNISIQPQRERTLTETRQERYALRVGAFSTAVNAEKQKSFFESKGYAAEITNKVRDGRSFYVVWIGAYSNSDEAKKAAKVVKTKYKIDSMVVEK